MRTAILEKTFNSAIVLLFLGLIFIPPVKMFLSPDKTFSQTEKRKLSDFPAAPGSFVELKSYFKGIDSYLNDHFGYRDFFIQRYQTEISKRFGKTGLESKVQLGRDGWYYYTAEKQLEDFQGELTLSDTALENWIEERNKRKAWLSSLGIEYLLMAPPGKHSIYPEHLPTVIRDRKGTSRFEQLLAYTADKPLPYLVNLHAPLLAAKGESLLYYKSDTHWNMRGAYTAFATIIHSLEQLFPESEFTTDFRFAEDEEKECGNLPQNCDLARMVMHQDQVSEVFPTLEKYRKCAKPKSFHHYDFSNFQQSREKPSFVRGCKKRELTAIVFRDSFFVDIQPFLSENFRHVVYLWKDYDQKNIEEVFEIYTPDVVIEAIVERDFFD